MRMHEEETEGENSDITIYILLSTYEFSYPPLLSFLGQEKEIGSSFSNTSPVSE